MSAVDILKATQRGTGMVQMPIRRILAQPGEYD